MDESQGIGGRKSVLEYQQRLRSAMHACRQTTTGNDDSSTEQVDAAMVAASNLLIESETQNNPQPEFQPPPAPTASPPVTPVKQGTVTPVKQGTVTNSPSPNQSASLVNEPTVPDTHNKSCSRTPTSLGTSSVRKARRTPQKTNTLGETNQPCGHFGHTAASAPVRDTNVRPSDSPDRTSTRRARSTVKPTATTRSAAVASPVVSKPAPREEGERKARQPRHTQSPLSPASNEVQQAAIALATAVVKDSAQAPQRSTKGKGKGKGYSVASNRHPRARTTSDPHSTRKTLNNPPWLPSPVATKKSARRSKRPQIQQKRPSRLSEEAKRKLARAKAQEEKVG